MGERTETKMEFLGTAAINPLVTCVSSPRAVMDSNHTAQHLPLLTPEEPIVKSGIEYELGKYINDARTEHNCTVKAIIPKFQNGALNVETILLVEYERNGRDYLDFMEIQEYMSSHNMFGYKLSPTEEFNSLYYNASIPAGTVLGAAASYGPDGSYDFTVNANVAFMSHPSVAEDGFAVSEEFLQRLKYTVVTKRVINLTKNLIPLNINGDANNYKFLPDIGEAVRPDGLLCAYREGNEWFTVVDMSDEALCELDGTFDVPVMVPTNSVVVDIKIVRGNYNKPEYSSTITSQLDYYAEAQINFYKEIVDRYNKVIAEKVSRFGGEDSIRVTPRLTRFIADCMIKINATNGKQKLSHRKLPIDQYMIEVTVCSVRTPNYGNKLTDYAAAKGVICSILPASSMPVDSNGVRADIITDSSSTISRMNLSRAYMAYLGAMSRDNKMRLQTYLFNKYGVNYLHHINSDDINFIMNYLRGIYKEINSDMLEFLDSLETDEEKLNHITECLTRNIHIYLPTDNEINIVDIISSIENTEYKPHLGKVTYIDDYGTQVVSEENIRIGNMPFMLLDKVASDGSSVSSAKTNSFNFPVKGNNSDKYKYPHSLTPTTTLGETEVRILTSFASPNMVAEMLDLAMNPVSHKQLVKSIYNSEQAYNPELELDRNVNSYGNTKSLGLLRHVFNAAGFDIQYTEPDYLNK